MTACGTRGKSEEPAALTAQGWHYYRLDEFNLAARSFEEALERAAGNGEQQARALYGLAMTCALRRPGEDPARAKDLLERIVREFPKNEMAPWSLLALARMEHMAPPGTKPDYDAVRDAYDAVIEAFPGHLAGHEAFIQKQATYFAQGGEQDTRTALENLEGFLARHPDSPFKGLAYSMLSSCHGRLKNYDAQLETRIAAYRNAERDPLNPYTTNLWDYWDIATIAEYSAGDFDLAREYYRKLIQEYPQDKRRFPAEQALARMDRIERDIRRRLAAERGEGAPQ